MFSWLRSQQSARRFYLAYLIGVLLISLLLLSASAMIGDSPDLIVSDGNGYYAWLRSLAIDGDLDLANDLQALYAPEPAPGLGIETPKGLTPNKYPIGIAILEIPGFLLGHAIANVTPFPRDGLSLPYQLAITLSLVIFVLGSFYLFFLALEKVQISSGINLLISITALMATNLIHYVAKEPAMSHGAGVALMNCLIFLSLYRPGFIRYPLTSRLLTGVLIGLLLITRLSNVVFLPLIIYLFKHELKLLKGSLLCFIGMVAMMLLQQLSQFLLWGHWVGNPYGDEGFTAGIQGLLSVIFGPGYGIFIYHPWFLILLLLNIIGLIQLTRYRGLLGMILISVLSLWCINGLWGFAGDSFGNRAFIELLPALSLGAAITLNSIQLWQNSLIQRFSIALVGIAIALNFYLWAGYLFQKYPHNGERTPLQAYLWLR